MNEQSKTLEVLLVEPGKQPQMTTIGGDLKSLQDAVGGSIEAAYFFEDVVLVCNEEGKNLGLPLNRSIRDENEKPFEIIAGTFFLCGMGEEDFCSLPKELQMKYEDKFKQPEAFLRTDKGIMIVPIDPAPKEPKKAKTSPQMGR